MFSSFARLDITFAASDFVHSVILTCSCSSCMATILAASRQAFFAPLSPIEPTGTPGGICAMESSASNPSRAPPFIGTPSTGRDVAAAMTPGSAAESPATAIMTSMPRFLAF